MDQDENKEEDQKEEEEDLSNPKIKTLHSVKNQLTEEEYKIAKEMINNNVKKMLMIINCYELTNDQGDFIHSIQRVAK